MPGKKPNSVEGYHDVVVVIVFVVRFVFIFYDFYEYRVD